MNLNPMRLPFMSSDPTLLDAASAFVGKSVASAGPATSFVWDSQYAVWDSQYAVWE